MRLVCDGMGMGIMLKIAVCDDEKYDRERIKKLWGREMEKRGVYDYAAEEYTAGAELLEGDVFSGYDVIFLDINMPGANGLEIAERIRETGSRVILVFITAFVDYAIEGYKTGAIRFLLKDMLEQSFSECVEAITVKLSLQAYKVRCSCRERETEIPVEKICYIESMAHKVWFHVPEAGTECYSRYEKLDHMEEVLSKYGFLRIHKSYLVNIKYVDEIANYAVRLKDGGQLPIPRERFRQVKERYYEMMGDML